MRRLLLCVCVTLIVGDAAGGTYRHVSLCRLVPGGARFCTIPAKADVPRVNGGTVLPMYYATISGMHFRCRAHVYPGGLISRCVLAKSPLTA